MDFDWILWNFICISDSHWNPRLRIPQSRTETYHEDCLKEWNAFTKLVWKEKKVSGVIHAGDWFHLKNQSLYPPGDILYYRDWVLGLQCPVFTVPGNHDLPQSSYDNVQKTAYQTLVHATPNMHDFSFQTEQVNSLMFGEVNEGSYPQLYISGIPYLPLDKLAPACRELDARLADLPGIHIVILHPDAIPGNEALPFLQTCSWSDLLRALPHATVLILGHIHNSFPILQTTEFSASGSPQFVCKPWSFGRVVKDYHQGTTVLEHQHKISYTQIQIGVKEGQGGNGKIVIHCEYHEIPQISFEKAFSRETLRREVEKAEKVSSFISSLKDQGTIEDAFSIENPKDYLDRMTVSQEVREIINYY